MSIPESQCPVWKLGVIATLLLSLFTALALTLLAIRVGGNWLLLVVPVGFIYLAGFGAAMLSAIAESRILPKAKGLRFAIPIICSLMLVVGSGIVGILFAYFLNDTFFHMAQKAFRL